MAMMHHDSKQHSIFEWLINAELLLLRTVWNYLVLTVCNISNTECLSWGTNIKICCATFISMQPSSRLDMLNPGKRSVIQSGNAPHLHTMTTSVTTNLTCDFWLAVITKYSITKILVFLFVTNQFCPLLIIFVFFYHILFISVSRIWNRKKSKGALYCLL